MHWPIDVTISDPQSLFASDEQQIADPITTVPYSDFLERRFGGFAPENFQGNVFRYVAKKNAYKETELHFYVCDREGKRRLIATAIWEIAWRVKRSGRVPAGESNDEIEIAWRRGSLKAHLA
jgi:hypothetical protein